ncbi:hypothetical protein X975_04133, partial [Stegodyphus mimosarum]
MDVVPGIDTGQHQLREEPQIDSRPSPLTVMTAGVNESPPQNTIKKKKGGVDEEMEEGSGDFPPSIAMPQPEGAGDEADGGGMLDDEGDASNNSSASDVETFNGKIVYNPDGSAYIIEGVDSELSDDEYGSLDLFPFLPSAKSSSARTSSSPRQAAQSPVET